MKLHALALGLAFAAAPLAIAAEPKPYAYTTLAAQPSDAADREIAGLFERWNQALQSGDVARVVSLYSPDAVLQPTVSNRVRSNPAAIQDYFEHFLALKPVGEINYRHIRRLGPGVALDSGVYTFRLSDAHGQSRQVQARYTFIYTQVEGEWKILNHHSSAMPEVPSAQVAARG